MYADKGISGKNSSRGPQFLKMINAAKNGQIDIIYCKSVQRFARNTSELFENVSNNDFIWIQYIDSFEKREVVKAFINKGYISKLEEIDYEGLPHLIVNLKSILIYHFGPSMAITLKNNGVKRYEGDEFIVKLVN